MARARADGLKLTGKDGLLGQLTKRVVESALDGKLDDHLGYQRHQRGGSADGNDRNGKRAKTILTETGEVQIEVPRDRDGSFSPTLVAKRQHRLTGLDDMIVDHRPAARRDE